MAEATMKFRASPEEADVLIKMVRLLGKTDSHYDKEYITMRDRYSGGEFVLNTHDADIIQRAYVNLRTHVPAESEWVLSSAMKRFNEGVNDKNNEYNEIYQPLGIVRSILRWLYRAITPWDYAAKGLKDPWDYAAKGFKDPWDYAAKGLKDEIDKIEAEERKRRTEDTLDEADALSGTSGGYPSHIEE